MASSEEDRLGICMLVDAIEAEAGTEKLVPRLAADLDGRRFEPHVCCFEGGERLKELGGRVRTAQFPLTSVFSAAGLRQMSRFRRYLEANRIAVVHSFMIKSDLFGILSTLPARRHAMVISRLSTGYWHTRSRLWQFRVLDRLATHVMTNSLAAKKFTCSVEKVPEEKVTVWYPGVDVDRFSSGDAHGAAFLGIPEDAKVVGIVANYRAVKDLPLFVKAARIIAAEVPNAAFLLVGNGELGPQLEQLAEELGVRSRVFFSGGRGEVRDYLARMSVACLSSLSESLPNAILEYMAAGLPVVATDVGGVAELVADGVTGFVVGERTPEAFAAPIARLLRDETLRSAMGRRGFERVSGELDWPTSILRIERFYLDAAASVRAKRP